MTRIKMQPQEIIEEIADDLIIYLKNGQLAPSSFIEELNLDINNLQQLLRAHFILKDEVRDFVKQLPNRLRNIKTSNQKITQFLQGEVRGKINWQDTIKRRCKRNNLNQNIFICQQMDRNFNIKENLVLKRLLEIIHQITINDLEVEKKNYAWLADWLGDQDLAQQLEEIYFKNIYLNRIEHDQVRVTPRMIADTKKSRNLLYQDAAQLLDFYRRLTNVNRWTENERSEIKELLSNTFIRPQADDVLFELYWAIKLINENTEQEQLNLIDGSSNLVTSWEAQERKYFIYHDTRGSGRLNWQVNLNELEETSDPFLRRRVEGYKLSQELNKGIFNKELSNTYWQGRPDIVIEIVNQENKKLEKVIIGEVKYTNNFDTVKQGLTELIDYLVLIRDENGYFSNNKLTEPRIELEGLLLFDEISAANNQIQGVKIYNQQSDWKTKVYETRNIKIF